MATYKQYKTAMLREAINLGDHVTPDIESPEGLDTFRNHLFDLPGPRKSVDGGGRFQTEETPPAFCS